VRFRSNNSIGTKPKATISREVFVVKLPGKINNVVQGNRIYGKIKKGAGSV